MALSFAFASQSRVKAVNVRLEFSTLQKGNQSAIDYFMTIEHLLSP
jgi:hypothetical protein